MSTKTYTLDTPEMYYRTIDRAGVTEYGITTYYLVETIDRTNKNATTWYYPLKEAQGALRKATNMLEHKLEHDGTESEPFTVRLVLVIGDYRRTIIDTL